MLDWLKGFLTTHGPSGAWALALLILLAQNANLLPAAHDVMAGANNPSPPPMATPEQMAVHIQQAQQQIEELRSMKEEQRATNRKLDRNHETQSTGLRILCITQAKNDAARTECAKIN